MSRCSREILPRLSAELAYNRRSWGNFFYTDNRAVGPQDYHTLTFAAPTHPDLATSGQPVSYKLLKEAAFGRVDNYYTFASDSATSPTTGTAWTSPSTRACEAG